MIDTVGKVYVVMVAHAFATFVISIRRIKVLVGDVQKRKGVLHFVIIGPALTTPELWRFGYRLDGVPFYVFSGY